MQQQETRDSLRVMQRHSDECAFTLIEILVVMTLIAILVGMGVPAFTSVMNQARKTQAKNEEQQIVAAVNAYYTEYGKYPIAGSGADVTFTGITAGTSSGSRNGAMIDVLQNNINPTGPNYATVTSWNPRSIVFIQPPVSKRSDQTEVRHPNFDRYLVRSLGIAI
jgi:prepilin-type N-terminal cleavage/methylation domain-containing protein